MDSQETQAPPGWFKAAAIGALLWELFGCTMYVLHVTADPAALPADQQAMWAATPGWSIAAFAIAVWVGLAGAVLLLMRRQLAVPLLLVSLLAVLVQFSAHVMVPELRDLTPPAAWAMPIAVMFVCLAIWLLASHAKRQGWLR